MSVLYAITRPQGTPYVTWDGDNLEEVQQYAWYPVSVDEDGNLLYNEGVYEVGSVLTGMIAVSRAEFDSMYQVVDATTTNAYDITAV